jgi:Skp family chaperone for outer membrane proteins
MKALKGSAEERDLLKRYTGELNAQEDKLAALRSELASLHAQRNAADAEFQAKLGAIDIDEAI